MFFSKGKKLVQIIPMLFIYALNCACGFQPYYIFAVAVYPDTRTVDAIADKLLESLIPEFFVHIAAEIVPVLPGGVCTVYPEFLTVNVELAVGNADLSVRKFDCLRGFA